MKINLNNAEVIKVDVTAIKGKKAQAVFISDGHNALLSQRDVYHAMADEHHAQNRFNHFHYTEDDVLLSKRLAQKLYPRIADAFEKGTNKMRFARPEAIIKLLERLDDPNVKPYVRCLKSKYVHKMLSKVKQRPLSKDEQMHILKAKNDAYKARIEQLEVQNEREFNVIDKAKADLRDKESCYNSEIYRLGKENENLRKDNKKLNEFNFALKQAKAPKLTRWDHFKALFRNDANE